MWGPINNDLSTDSLVKAKEKTVLKSFTAPGLRCASLEMLIAKWPPRAPESSDFAVALTKEKSALWHLNFFTVCLTLDICFSLQVLDSSLIEVWCLCSQPQPLLESGFVREKI